MSFTGGKFQMPKLSNKEYLLNKLRELCAGKDKKILNSDIYRPLGWDRTKFHKIRDQLYDEGVLTYDGHYTKFVDFKDKGLLPPKCKIFISYSHADESLKEEMLKHMAPLAHLNLIQTWHDRKMKAGDHIDTEISRELRNANLVLLLVSADFLNSEYCYHVEMEEAVKRHNRGETTVIPVILRHCYWKETPFGDLLAATKDAKPVSDYPSRDEAFLEVVKAIRIRIER
jgi:hypothetical protein